MKKKTFNYDKSKSYKIDEALKIVKDNAKTKFDSSIDIAIKLNLDTSKAEQQLRGTVTLPNFFGKKQKILVLNEGLTDKDAKAMNVEFAGGRETIDKIATGWMDFDLIITTPKMMPLLSRLGKVLGPRGLMPNPKIGNVTNDLKKTIDEFQKGVSQYRTDSYGNIHMLVGKVSGDLNKVNENIVFLLNFIKSKRPSTVKGTFIKNVSISSTMGPGVKLEFNQ
ncbi:MAG: 50S ribosomal protein L1 [Mycoplasmoidaceae bacterium]